MTQALYLEPVGGIAGDMFLACCIDLGVKPEELEAGLKPLALSGWRLAVTRTERHSIAGTHIEVLVEPDDERERTWAEIRQLIHASQLSTNVKSLATRTFEALARAEAHVHGVEVEQVHFHEVGAVDSIIDIVGASVCLELLGFPKVFAAPPPLGSGLVRSRHGMVPVPGPATLELLKDRPVRFEGVGELTTPTGAALLAALTSPGPPAELVPLRIGLGLGTRDPADRPNLLRGTLGSTDDRAGLLTPETLWVSEANLDDMNPQLFGPLMESLFALGALDVWVAPVLMKKGRPGQILGVLCASAALDSIRAEVFRQSTTLGIRTYPVDRIALERREIPVMTPLGPLTVKVGYLKGKPVNATPEFEDCRRLSLERGVPIKEVVAAATAAYEAGRASDGKTAAD